MAVVTNFWKESAGGGIKTFLVGFTDELQAEGIPHFVLFREGRDPKNVALPRNKLLFMAGSLLELLRSKPKVTISLSYWFCLIPGLMYRKVSGTRLIGSVHTVADDPSFLNRRMMRFLWGRCDVVAFTTVYMEAETKKIYGATFRKSIITYAGVNPPSIPEEEVKVFRTRYGLTDGDIMLLGHGLLNHRLKYEGVKLLMSSLKLLLERHPRIVLVLTGEGRYAEELKSYARQEGIASHVVFTGNLQNPFLAVRACDIFTHITLNEALSMAVLEAMSQGKPVVASAVGGIPEIINESNGRLVSNEPEEIAESIERFISDREDRERKGRKAELDARRYTWERTVRAYQDNFR
ncbi:MAG: glycosyltransferase family 4 protein [Methanomassiliicoccus sp.]|nr:glycosyltransferase family 4 protein [Methanomassiliicoccus sp.]